MKTILTTLRAATSFDFGGDDGPLRGAIVLVEAILRLRTLTKLIA